MEPPSDLQRHHGIAYPGQLEDGVTDQEGKVSIRCGGGLPAHRGDPALLPPRIPHIVAFMVMALAFHTEDPDGVGDAFNILFLPDLSPLAGSEVALLT